jgi:hypothetical protein
MMTAEEKKASRKEYWLRNRVRLLAEMKAKYHANKDVAAKKYQENRLTILAQKKADRKGPKGDWMRQRERNYVAANRDKVLAAKRAADPGWEKAKARGRDWYWRNQEKILSRKRNYSSTPSGKTRIVLMNTLKRITNKGGTKTERAIHYLGCSIEKARAHIESLFKPGMTWANHGVYGWHVDHKRPLVSFDLTDEKQAMEASHYTNLEPLWAKENLSKGSKFKL